ncbi:hypothetical protein NIES4101_59030 [Calothrix sp. NIES-4101]|nr:hypothetical protein NIES4101_59030 [Calothrix sp. NIES-4101]
MSKYSADFVWLQIRVLINPIGENLARNIFKSKPETKFISAKFPTHIHVRSRSYSSICQESLLKSSSKTFLGRTITTIFPNIVSSGELSNH